MSAGRPAHRPRLAGDIIDGLICRPQGASVAECCEQVPSVGTRAMLKRLQNLCTDGRACSAKEPGRLSHRWFSTTASRDAWAAANPQTPTQAQIKAAARQQRGPTMLQRIEALVLERGSHGTLCADIAAELDHKIGNISSWVTALEQRGKVDCLIYRHIRIVTPAGVPLRPGALQSCQRRIDATCAKRGALGKYAVMSGKPGQPAGVTVPTAESWADRPAANAGQVPVQVGASPKFDHRYQVDPAQRIRGGLADLGLGRYDMDPSHAVAQWLCHRADASGAASRRPRQC